MTSSIRECTPDDFPRIVDYFLDAAPEDWARMGVDPAKIPDRDEWIGGLRAELSSPIPERRRYYLVFEVDGTAIGHSNLSDAEFGRVANMHLHIWRPEDRRRGVGTRLVRACVDRYFEVFELETLLCEPHADNPAPNRTLPKLGFELVETYFGVPGALCRPQSVNRWRLTREAWMRAKAGGSAIYTLFFSRLEDLSAADRAEYQERQAALDALVVSGHPGFLDQKSFVAEDGERLTVVRFRDEESQRAWGRDPDHRAAQRRGRDLYYRSYDIVVCRELRAHRFRRTSGPDSGEEPTG